MTAPTDGLWTGLDPQVPVLLVPVRLETRYGTRPITVQDGRALTMPVLRVRIYPDDLSVTASAPGLATAERAAGKTFWDEQQVTDDADVPGSAEHRRRAAWEVLVRRVGRSRAAHVADATRPGAPPPADRSETAPTARLLPDGWVITGDLGGDRVFTSFVPRTGPDPQVGPSRTGQDAFDPHDATLLPPHDELRWIADFDKAVAIGMAAVIDLATVEQVAARTLPPVVTDGIDTLVVVGVREPSAQRSLDTEADAFADLLTTHAAADRVAFVAQGTPTNNLTTATSGWSSASDLFAGYDRVVNPGTAPPPLGTDVPALHGGARDSAIFETALGLPAGVTAGLDGADGREQWLARTMATALFPVTIGEAIGTLARPVFAPDDAEQQFLARMDTVMPVVREHVASFVRGRGPLPALRIGRQPYGVLPVLPTARWVRADREPEQLARLSTVLSVLRRYWEQAATGVPALRPGRDPSAELVRILGLGPTPHPGGYRVRVATGRLGRLLRQMSQVPPVSAVPAVTGAAAARIVARGAEFLRAVSVAAYKRVIALSIGDLVKDTEFTGLSLADARPMRVPVAATDPARTDWTSPAEYLTRLAAGAAPAAPGERRPTDLLFVLAEHALALAEESDTLGLLSGISPSRFGAVLAVAPEVRGSGLSIAAPAAKAFSAPVIELADAGVALPAVGHVALSELVRDDARRNLMIDALRLPKFRVGSYAGTRAAVAELGNAQLSDTAYTRLTGEALACASTRLDAWLTSLATQRLATLRDQRPGGLQLGAWGVLVDVRLPASAPVPDGEVPVEWPGVPVPDDEVPADWTGTRPLRRPSVQVGYVHAPSQAQARTAGVLRAGELAHGGDGTSLATIDLTSARVRAARDVLDAMANGQPLGALLGYRLERLLGDREMYAAITTLRAAYPQRRVGGDAGDPASETDAVVPAEVVDGLEVWQHRGTVVTHHPGLKTAAFAEVMDELGRVVDAVSDLLVAEGVHDITSGRPDAAGALFTAVAEGAPPPEPTVARTPRSGLTITHRVVLVLEETGGSTGWNRSAPRATVAPAAERWAEELLGPAADLRVVLRRGGDEETVRLDDLGLCALDLLVEARETASGTVPLDARLVAAASDAGAALAPDDKYRELLALARAAGDVLATGRPIVAADVKTPPKADSLDFGTVAAVPPPTAAELQPIADDVAVQLIALENAVVAVVDAAEGMDPTADMDASLLEPFAAAGIPGAVRRGVTVPLRDLVGIARTAAVALRDTDELIAQGLKKEAAGALGATPSLRDRLHAVCAGDVGLPTLVKIARRVFGDAVVPTLAVKSDLRTSEVDGPEPADIERWLARTGRVRRAIATYDDLRLFTEARGDAPADLRAFQLPFDRDDGWITDPLPLAPRPDTAGDEDEKRPNELRAWRRPAGPLVHVVAAGRAEAARAAEVGGLVLDEVVEVLPAPTASTGLAVHYDAPNARPPQTLLLAVVPDPAVGWSWSLLDETVREALALSRLRGVDHDDLMKLGVDEYLPLTYARDGLPGTTPLSRLDEGLVWSRLMTMATRLRLRDQ